MNRQDAKIAKNENFYTKENEVNEDKNLCSLCCLLFKTRGVLGALAVQIP